MPTQQEVDFQTTASHWMMRNQDAEQCAFQSQQWKTVGLVEQVTGETLVES